MHEVSHRVIRFRCAKTSRHFLIGFHRPNPPFRFLIVSVVAEHDRPEVTPTDNASTSLTTSERSAARNTGSLELWPAVRQSTTRMTKWFRTSTERANKASAEAPSPYQEGFRPEDFDLNGWYCPCCGHGEKRCTQHQFIQCSKCGE